MNISNHQGPLWQPADRDSPRKRSWQPHARTGMSAEVNCHFRQARVWLQVALGLVGWGGMFVPISVARAYPLQVDATIVQPATENADGPSADLANGSSPEGIGQEDRSHWEYYAMIDTSQMAPQPPHESGLAAFTILPEVFARTRFDLADLRVIDAMDQPIAYSLRTLAPQTIRDRVAFNQFDESTSPNGTREFKLELTAEEAQHNEIKIVTSGNEFRRKVDLARSDDGRDWEELETGYLMRFDSDGSQYVRDALRYPTSRSRFLRIRIFPDVEKNSAGKTWDSISVDEVAVLQTVTLAGERSEYPATLQERQPTRRSGALASTWLIDLGVSGTPCNRLEFEVADSEFVRDYEIEVEDATNVLGQALFRMDYSTERQPWKRTQGDAKSPMTINFSESFARRYRLTIYDHRNLPLTITSVKASGDKRQVILPKSDKLSQGVRLYFGNPNADVPNYDFSRGLPARLDLPPTPLALGDIVSNPEFVPPPIPITERYPWLVYAVMIGVCSVLLLIIFGLASHAIKIHEETAKYTA